MNIKRIRVEGLFHTFTHEISFDEKVTIIMGENGVGKTVTLNLIDAIFNGRFDYLIETEYTKIVVTFLKETWVISRTISEYKKEFKVELEITSSKKDSKVFTMNSDMVIPKFPPFFDKIGDNMWFDNRSHTFYDKEQMLERFGIETRAFEARIPEWYKRQMDRNKVKMIKTQRLISTNSSRRESSNLYMVKVYSTEIAKLMQNEINKAGLKGAEIDRTFPVRLLKYMKGHVQYYATELFQDLNELDSYRYKLSSVGLLPETEIETAYDKLMKDLDKLDKNMLSVMNLYIKDSREKLSMYGQIYNKISILKDIINLRFNHKQLHIDSKKGFVIKPIGESNEEIPVEKLSSGEQNELVLFYELLFKSDSKDLILIDEPEISLHLAWLQAMICDFKRITDESQANLLIATHSPDFVGDNYDLVQNLE